jgi:hypothetical protein
VRDLTRKAMWHKALHKAFVASGFLPGFCRFQSSSITRSISSQSMCAGRPTPPSGIVSAHAHKGRRARTLDRVAGRRAGVGGAHQGVGASIAPGTLQNPYIVYDHGFPTAQSARADRALLPEGRTGAAAAAGAREDAADLRLYQTA